MTHIIDHPLPPWCEQSFAQEFYRYPLEYNHRILDGANPFFGRCLYNRQTGVELTAPRGVSNLLDALMLEIVPQAYVGQNYGQTLRVVVNGMTSVNDPGAHTDYDEEDVVTAVYMLLGQSGDLEVGSETVPWAEHRLVMFPANQMHRALPPNANDWRVTVAVNFTLV